MVFLVESLRVGTPTKADPVYATNAWHDHDETVLYARAITQIGCEYTRARTLTHLDQNTLAPLTVTASFVNPSNDSFRDGKQSTNQSTNPSTIFRPPPLPKHSKKQAKKTHTKPSNKNPTLTRTKLTPTSKNKKHRRSTRIYIK